MSSEELLLCLKGRRLVVWGTPGDVRVAYENAEIQDGIILKGEYGEGETYFLACEDYLRKIRGKTIVFNAGGDNREEVTVLG